MSRLEKIDRLKASASKRVSKRSRRKEELADFAIDALKQLGYARTSLRDIAEHSGVSVGMLHYYFDDKVDLISFCVRKYKADFMAQMDETLRGPPGSNSVVERFVNGLGNSIQDDAETHRLWFDIRTQAMFEDSFQGVVDEIEQGLIEVVERLLERIDQPKNAALGVYLAMDGPFRYYLQQHLAGDKTAVEGFQELIGAQLKALANT